MNKGGFGQPPFPIFPMRNQNAFLTLSFTSP